ncbi:hypothetical protein J7J60_01975 [bacterium]|nr:hypothetical protein [bacterium]
MKVYIYIIISVLFILILCRCESVVAPIEDGKSRVEILGMIEVVFDFEEEKIEVTSLVGEALIIRISRWNDGLNDWVPIVRKTCLLSYKTRTFDTPGGFEEGDFIRVEIWKEFHAYPPQCFYLGSD